MTNLEKTIGLYSVGERATITRETVDHDGVTNLLSGVRNFLREIPEPEEGTSEHRLCRVLRRARWHVGTVPLPFSHGQLALNTAAKEILDIASHAAGPEMALVKEIARLLHSLAKLDDDPLGDLVREIAELAPGSKTGLLVTDGKSLEAVQKAFAATAGLHALVASQLRSTESLDTILAVGASDWFEPHVISAPRAEQVCFVHYSGVLDGTSSSGILFKSESNGVDRDIRNGVVRQVHSDFGSAADFQLEIDWSPLAGLAKGTASHSGDDISSGLAIYVSPDSFIILDPMQKVAAIDIGELTAGEATNTVEARRLVVGTAIVIRSEDATKDLIAHVADAILGPEATFLRKRQQEWKNELRDWIRKFGRSGVEASLKMSGYKNPHLDYRLSPHSMKTQRREDWDIMMNYLKLGADRDALWEDMKKLNSAHQKAGREIRRRLDELLLQQDWPALFREGHLNVETDEESLGSLSVHRIEGINPEPVQAPTHDFNRLIASPA